MLFLFTTLAQSISWEQQRHFTSLCFTHGKLDPEPPHRSTTSVCCLRSRGMQSQALSAAWLAQGPADFIMHPDRESTELWAPCSPRWPCCLMLALCTLLPCSGAILSSPKPEGLMAAHPNSLGRSSITGCTHGPLASFHFVLRTRR